MINEDNLLVKIYGKLCWCLGFIQGRIETYKRIFVLTKEVLKENPGIGYKELKQKVDQIINSENISYAEWNEYLNKKSS